jgi:predicted 3-demethylubiquinone-9 3-methyltransferase (glyoxalase superfamily)
MKLQKISPCLWFDDKAEDAATYYCKLFKNSKINHVSRWGENGPRKAGLALMVDFELDGLAIKGLNGGPEYKLSPAFSLSVSCEDQDEIDRLWAKLVDGGKESRCGWLDDRFGVSWQIVPAVLGTLMSDKNPAKVQAVMAAFMGMVNFDIRALQQAYDKA